LITSNSSIEKLLYETLADEITLALYEFDISSKLVFESIKSSILKYSSFNIASDSASIISFSNEDLFSSKPSNSSL